MNLARRFGARHLVAMALILGVAQAGAPAAAAHVLDSDADPPVTECLPRSRTPTVDPLAVTVASCGALGAASVMVFLVAAPKRDDEE